MSVQAITWALEEAPDVPPQLVSTLIALANHADRYGCNSYPSTDTLTAYTRKSHRQVQRDLDELASKGLIRQGDRAHVAHIRADRRPQVWDLATERKRERGDTGDTPSDRDGVSRTTPRNAGRGVTHDVPQRSDGVSPVTERGDTGDRNGVTPVPPEPSLEPSKNQTSRPRSARTTTREADARFVEFYDAYPRHVARKAAEKAWRKVIRDGADPDEVIKAARRYAESRAGADSRFTKHPATWLNGGCWTDEPDPPPSPPQPNHRTATTDQRVIDGLSLAAQYRAAEERGEFGPLRSLPGGTA
jgi:hypothetical protein